MTRILGVSQLAVDVFVVPLENGVLQQLFSALLFYVFSQLL